MLLSEETRCQSVWQRTRDLKMLVLGAPYTMPLRVTVIKHMEELFILQEKAWAKSQASQHRQADVNYDKWPAGQLSQMNAKFITSCNLIRADWEMQLRMNMFDNLCEKLMRCAEAHESMERQTRRKAPLKFHTMLSCLLFFSPFVNNSTENRQS